MHSKHDELISRQHLLWLALILTCIVMGVMSLFVNPLFLVVGLLVIANAVLIVTFPIWGLLFYLILFLYQPGEVYPALAPLRIELLLGILLLVVMFLHQNHRHGKISVPKDHLTLSLVSYLVIMFASMFTSIEKTETMNACQMFAKIIVFYLLIVSLIDERRKFIAFVTVFIVMIGKIAYDALKLYMSGGYITTMSVDRLHGATSSGGDPNALATTMVISIPFIIGAILYYRNWFMKSLLMILAGAMFYLIAITGSRGGLLGVLGIAIGGFVFAKRKMVVLAVCCVVTIGGWQLLTDQYKNRYRTLVNVEDANDTSSGRIEIWEAGLKMIASRPLLGVGAGTFGWAAVSGEYGYSRFMRAHNIFIQIAAETGFIGLVVWLFFITNAFGKLRELVRKTGTSAQYGWITTFSKCFMVSLIGLLVSGLFGHSLYRYNWYMIAGLAGAMFNILQAELSDRNSTWNTGENVIREAEALK